MLGERVRPVARVAADRIDRLIADLDDDDFAVRNKATVVNHVAPRIVESQGKLPPPSSAAAK